MEFLIEFFAELLIGGSIETAGNRRKPLIVRILAIVFLTVFYGGLVTICLYFGIVNGNVALTIFGVFLLLVLAFLFWKIFAHRGRR